MAPARAGTGLWRWRRRLGLAFIVVALVPFVLIPVYRFVPPVSTLMLYNWLTGQKVDRRWVPLSEIAPALAREVVTSEDDRFCVHHGVDWRAVAEAVKEDKGSPRGASTIAMQTMKNLFLWPSRDYVRKALEVPLALYANIVLGKRRTLEIYLNIVEWGPGIFGAEAAARNDFNESAAAITQSQAALLAAALPNPILRNPARPSRSFVALARNLGAKTPADLGCVGALR